MEQILREPVELTECELDAVAGGRGHPFCICQQNETGANVTVINIGNISVYDCVSSTISIANQK